MKKWILLALALSFAVSPEAAAEVKQNSINLSPFATLKVGGPFSVSLVRGSDYRALITVEEAYMDYVVCQVSSRELTIDLDERRVPLDVKRQFRGKGTPDPVFSVILYVPELIQAVSMTDKSQLVDTEDVFDKDRVVFSIEDAASVKLLELSSQMVSVSMQNKSTADFKVNCKMLDAKTANSSQLTIEEVSEDASYSLQGSSKIIAKNNGSKVNVNTKSNSYMTLVGSGECATYNMTGTSEVNAVDYEVPDAVITMTSVCKLSQAAYKTLKLNLNGGSTLLFDNDPAVSIENIKSSTISRLSKSRNGTRL